MAATQIADVVVPEIFTQYMMEAFSEKSLLVRSGIAAAVQELVEFMAGGGATANVPFWKPLSQTEANVSSDDPGTEAVPEKTDAGQQTAVRLSRNQSWRGMDLAAELAGSDPLDNVVARVAEYWVAQEQRRLNAIMDGIRADNVANDGGDMVNDIGSATVSGITAANLISANAIIDTLQTLGDSKGDITAIAMHSIPHAELQKQNLITFQPTNAQDIGFGTYLGKTIIVDDVQTVEGDGTENDPYVYTTTLFANGAIGRAQGVPKVPTAVDRNELAGNGGGMETLTSRVALALHPLGFRWLGAAVAGQSPTDAELANAANWDRVFDRKNCPLAWLQTNG